MRLLIILSIFISFVILLVFMAVDFIKGFYVWQARIRFGKWTDRLKWRKSVEWKAKKWLKHTPTIPKSDNCRLILLDIIKGNYYSRVIQSWQVAGLIMGLDDSDAKDFISSHKSYLVSPDLEIDYCFLLYALSIKGINVFDKESQLLATIYQDNIASIPYRKSSPNVRFVDTVGLVCPFLYSNGNGDLADRQIHEFDRLLLDGVFPPHAMNIDNYLPLGVYDWGRGLGWYILGLIESNRNEERIIRLAKKLLIHQRKDGSFGCFVFDPSSQRESSITSIAGLLFLKAYNITQEITFIEAAFGAEKALMSMTRRNGEIDFAQGDTKGIGMYSSRFDTMPFVQGMALYLSKKLDSCIDKIVVD